MYNNIKNFVKPHYVALFLVCIGCLLLLIFTKSRIEGVRNRRPNVNSIQTADISNLKTSDSAQNRDITTLKTSDSAQNRDITTLKTSDTAQTTNIAGLNTQTGEQISTLNKRYDELNNEFKTVKSGLTGLETKVQSASEKSASNATANTSVIADANAKAIADLRTEIDSKKTGMFADVDSKNAELFAKLDSKSAEQLTKNASLLQNLDSKQTEILNNMDLKQKEISDSLYNKSTMYITEMKNEATKFDEVKKSVMNARDETLVASEKAKEWADSAEDIYKNVFGKSTHNAVVTATQQPAATQQAFTTMFSGVNFVPNTGYYETFVERERFEPVTVPLRSKPGNQPLDVLTADVVSKMNNFNAAYSTYVLVPPAATAGIKELKLADLTSANSELKTALDRLAAAYPTTTNNSSYKNDAKFKIDHAAILEKSKEIDGMRQELDAKMENILKGRAPQNEFTNEYDSTVYTGVLWSILGTSLLYYIFTEL